MFDEHVFPFTSLHPNAGARLQSELALLLDVLKNSSSKFGNAKLCDQHLFSSASTNRLLSQEHCFGDTRTNCGENDKGTSGNGDIRWRYLLYHSHGTAHRTRVIRSLYRCPHQVGCRTRRIYSFSP